MRICIFGAGAVGSHFAVRLALAGHEVSCVMRGPHLAAMKADGLCLRVGDNEFRAKVAASDDPASLGAQDVVISTLKATALNGLVHGLPPLLREDTAVVFAQNGIPWWYDIGLSVDLPKPPDLGFLDPGGRLRAVVRSEQIVGGVIFSANEIVAPGIVNNTTPERNRLTIGACDDRLSPHVEGLRATLNAAGIESPSTANIRETIWSKLLTNVTQSVMCLLTGQTSRELLEDPTFSTVFPRLIEEAHQVALSCCPDFKPVTRTGRAPQHKPSLLQDYELGRAMEIDVLVKAPLAFARAAELATPMLDLMASLAIQKARDKGLYQV